MTPREFANLMERELVANEHKGDFYRWNPTIAEAMRELADHVAKLCFVLGGCEGTKITEHAADIGNIAMRIADLFGLPIVIPAPDSSWANGRSVETEILARAMMSAIRFGHQNDTRFQTEMRRLCNLIDTANQTAKDEACQTSPTSTAANHLNDAASGAASGATFTSSIRNSARGVQTATNANAKTTTRANAKGGSATKHARRAAKR
ncbi:hypothetical protein [Terriglobus sp. RCC_193]|uniref:hypothetical protein n=1 Tax=Terriglobus sp. RCC_193 TaxID=3239218 RepID=UPI0035250881